MSLSASDMQIADHCSDEEINSNILKSFKIFYKTFLEYLE